VNTRRVLCWLCCFCAGTAVGVHIIYTHIYIYIHTCMHNIYPYIHVHTCIHNIYTHIYICTHIRFCVDSTVSLQARQQLQQAISIYIFTHPYIHTPIYTYMHIHIYTHIQFCADSAVVCRHGSSCSRRCDTRSSRSALEYNAPRGGSLQLVSQTVALFA